MNNELKNTSSSSSLSNNKQNEKEKDIDYVPILNDEKSSSSSILCVICQENINNNNNSYVLPTCNHTFHTNCILHWFRNNHTNCPLCNNNGFVISEHNNYISFNDRKKKVNLIKNYCNDTSNNPPIYIKNYIKNLNNIEKSIKKTNLDLSIHNSINKNIFKKNKKLKENKKKLEKKLNDLIYQISIYNFSPIIVVEKIHINNDGNIIK